MAYVTAVTNKTAASYFNVADWTRIYGNSQLVNSLAEIMLDTPIDFDILTAPTITTIPSVTDFNAFLANIERTRIACAGESIPGTGTEIKDDYEAGPNKQAPNYVDANRWESTIDAIWEHFNGPDLDVDLVLSADLTVTTGTTLIIVDSLNANGFNITIEDGATLAIIP
jgi:hypothetical protein